MNNFPNELKLKILKFVIDLCINDSDHYTLTEIVMVNSKYAIEIFQYLNSKAINTNFYLYCKKRVDFYSYYPYHVKTKDMYYYLKYSHLLIRNIKRDEFGIKFVLGKLNE